VKAHAFRRRGSLIAAALVLTLKVHRIRPFGSLKPESFQRFCKLDQTLIL
jgi:hypothetical protein